jgi:hypothetical protein
LGDYFRNAHQPSEAELGAKTEKQGACISSKGEIKAFVRYQAWPTFLGPSLPASYRILIQTEGFDYISLQFDTNEASYFNQSIYMKNTGIRDIGIANAYLFRVRDSMLFLEAHREHPEGTKDSLLGKTALSRCYFW